MYWKNCFNLFLYTFECPKSIRNYIKKMLGTSDAWSMSQLSQQTSEPAYHIVDCRISKEDLHTNVLSIRDHFILLGKERRIKTQKERLVESFAALKAKLDTAATETFRKSIATAHSG